MRGASRAAVDCVVRARALRRAPKSQTFCLVPYRLLAMLNHVNSGFWGLGGGKQLSLAGGNGGLLGGRS